MTNRTTTIARQGLRGALELRMKLDVPSHKPVCVYDLAEAAGVEVKFRLEKSLGGMYDNVSKTILIPTSRPAGRMAFTCAHELGHWYFGDGVSVDKLKEIENWHSSSRKEQLANYFAAGLLMPSLAVKRAFERRGWNLNTPSTTQVFVVSTQLGVGYSTLVNHLRWSMQEISQDVQERLLRTKPKEIRAEILGHANSNHLIVADRFWEHVAIDLSVGDYAVLPNSVDVSQCTNLEIESNPKNGVSVRAIAPGINRVFNKKTSWCTFIRVSRRYYSGRARFRHLEEADDDD